MGLLYPTYPEDDLPQSPSNSDHPKKRVRISEELNRYNSSNTHGGSNLLQLHSSNSSSNRLNRTSSIRRLRRSYPIPNYYFGNWPSSEPPNLTLNSNTMPTGNPSGRNTENNTREITSFLNLLNPHNLEADPPAIVSSSMPLPEIISPNETSPPETSESSSIFQFDPFTSRREVNRFSSLSNLSPRLLIPGNEITSFRRRLLDSESSFNTNSRIRRLRELSLEFDDDLRNFALHPSRRDRIVQFSNLNRLVNSDNNGNILHHHRSNNNESSNMTLSLNLNQSISSNNYVNASSSDNNDNSTSNDNSRNNFNGNTNNSINNNRNTNNRDNTSNNHNNNNNSNDKDI